MKKNIGPRISAQAEKYYTDNFDSLNKGATYVLEAWPVLYRRTLAELKGRFVRGELCLMIDVSNGLFLTSSIAGEHLEIQCVDGMALDGLDEKWEIDRAEFTGKLTSLTLWQSAVLEVWARSFWEPEPGDLEKYVSRLTD
jgi:hypothetical protein